MELKLLGRYWEKDGNWTAEIESMNLRATASTPYMSLLKLLEKIDTKCSISVVDKGVFYVQSNDISISRSSVAKLLRKT